MGEFGGATLSVNCGHCCYAFEQPLSWAKKNLEFTCPRCDGFILVDERSVEEAEEALSPSAKAAFDQLVQSTTSRPANEGT
jgi:hypothetical protein